MNFRPAISAPLPWLTMLAGRGFGRRKGALKRPSPFKMPRSLSITREGKWFIAVLFLIGVAAINTGNNLLYLIVATLLSLIVVSGLMSESTLRGLKAARTLPAHVYKGSPVIARLRVENGKRRLPSFSFSVRELPADVRAEDAYFLKLKPGEDADRLARYTFLRRGRIALEGVKITTRFPFGIFAKGREELIRDEVIVYPSVTPASGSPAAYALERTGEAARGKKGPGAQIYGLRDYTMQDDSRFIHWRSAARASRLLVKEFEKESERKVYVVFDNFAATTTDAFEAAVDEAAAAANLFIESGYAVGLKTLAEDIKPLPGKDQLHAILRTLALIEPSEAKGTLRVRLLH